jgi:flagella basal body P-ring formation protein FlgA
MSISATTRGVRAVLAASLVCFAQAAWPQAAERSIDLETGVAEFLAGHCDEPIGRIDLPSLDALNREASAPGTSVSFSLARGRTQPGANAVRVTLVRGAGPVRRVVVTARVWVLRNVAVATRELRSGETLGTGDATTESREADTPRGEAQDDPTGAVGRRVRRHVKAGDVLLAAWLEEAPRVRRGERVTLRLVRGPLRIEMPGRAEQDGAAGAWIRVRNASSGREVTGRVADAGVVDVAL